MNYLNLLNRILEEDKVGRETRNGKTFLVLEQHYLLILKIVFLY